MAQEIFAKTYNKYLKAYHDKPNPWDILRLDEDRNYSAADPKDCNDIKVAKERAPKMFSTEAVNAAGEELLHGSIWARQRLVKEQTEERTIGRAQSPSLEAGDAPSTPNRRNTGAEASAVEIGTLPSSPIDLTVTVPSSIKSVQGKPSTVSVLKQGHKREASVQLVKAVEKRRQEDLFDIYDEDHWLLVPQHDRERQRIRIGYLNVRGKKKDAFAILAAGETAIMIGVRQGFLPWDKGVNKITYDLSEGKELWTEHNKVVKAWLELQLKALK